jgi:hypothetical protein
MSAAHSVCLEPDVSAWLRRDDSPMPNVLAELSMLVEKAMCWSSNRNEDPSRWKSERPSERRVTSKLKGEDV